MTEYRPWSEDPRYLVGDDGTILGVRGRPLAAQPNPENGYLQIGFRSGTRAVHVMVCEAFHGPRPAGLDAAHDNGNQLDNRASNLVWKTRSANHVDKSRHGTAVLPGGPGEANGRHVLTEQDVRAIRSARGVTRRALARRYGVHRKTIQDVLAGRTWTHLFTETDDTERTA